MIISEWTDHLNRRMKGRLEEYLSKGYVFLDHDLEVATFPFWTPLPIWSGYQEYRWKASKGKRNDPQEGRYYTYVSKGKRPLFGYFSIEAGKPLFITEGIFEAISVQAAGYPCVAILSNSTKPLKDWLSIQPSRTIALIQPDKASEQLAYSCHGKLHLSKDADEYPLDLLKEVLETSL